MRSKISLTEQTKHIANLNLERVVLEVHGGCNYSCNMCPQNNPGRLKNFSQQMPLALFENILDQISPKYGFPVINLEGSGEPAMAKNLDRYVKACSKRGLKSVMCTNGSLFSGAIMQKCLDEGLTLIRYSVIGYNKEVYKKWMNKDNWDLICKNVESAINYSSKNNLLTDFQSYHLITNPAQTNHEISLYRKNFIDRYSTTGYIWKMHNWAGNYSPDNSRKGQRRTCGRPQGPEIVVRAGGIGSQQGALTPCCQTMGGTLEEDSVLGHFSEQSFEDLWLGEKYQSLRKAHDLERFDDINYCKNCDFLHEDNETLAWSNSKDVKIGTPLETNLSFNT